MTINEKLLRVQVSGEEVGFTTIKVIRTISLFIGRSFKLIFGGAGVFVLGFILGLVRRQ